MQFASAVRQGLCNRFVRRPRAGSFGAFFSIILAVTVARVPPAAGGEALPLRSGCEVDYPPFSIVDETGRAGGFSVELMRAALAAMGRDVEFRAGTWPEVRGWLEAGEIEALPLVGRTPEREDIFDFTFSYMTLHGAIVVREDESRIQDIEDLRGRQVAVMRGDNAEEFLRREDRGIVIRLTETFDDALRELSAGRYDAVVTQRLVALRLIQEGAFANLKVLDRPIDGFRQDFCFAVREGDRDTLALLNEGLSIVMADGTYRRLHAEWFAALELPTNRRIVVGGDHNFPPFEFLDKSGRPAGYTVELVQAISKELGLDIEIRLGPWSDILHQMDAGEIDIVGGMFYLPERGLKYSFTPAHAMNDYVSVTRKDAGPPPSAVEDLAGKRIVAQQDDAVLDILRENGLLDQTALVETQEDVLREVAEGRRDCGLAVRISSMRLIEENQWSNLVLGRRPMLSLEYCCAAPQRQQALVAQFGEGLRILKDTGQYREIYDRWLGVYSDPRPNLMTILRQAALILAPLLALLLAFLLWSWSLRRQVLARTKSLQDSERRYRRLFEAANDGYLILDAASGKTRDVNPYLLHLLGRPASEVMGKALWEIEPLRGIADSRETFEALSKKGHIRLEALEIPTSDGRRVAVEVVSNAYLVEQSKALQLNFHDITVRKRAMDAQRESEQALQSMFDALRDGILLVEIETGRFLDANRAICQMLGHTREALLTMSIEDIHPPESLEYGRDQFQRHARGDHSLAEDITLRRRDGSLLQVDINASPLERDGKKCLLGVFRDVTDRNQMRSQLMHAQKMESVGRLAGGVAHDFNNLLSVIIGYAEMAMEQVKPGNPLRDDLKEIHNAARRSADITRQLLAFARKQTISPRPLDLNASIESTLKMLRRLIGEDIDLAWLPDSGLWPVLLDPSQLDQILANLCVNARDAIQGMGKITIETHNATLDEEYCALHQGFQPGQFALLEISDDGCGMDREIMANLFEPFFTTKKAGEGTGLGLATVHGIVKQNNGFINVYSEPGRGTTFKIYLPRHTGEFGAVSAAPARESAVGPGETLLVVEDEEAILKMSRMMLESLGYHVLTAVSPGEALQLAADHSGDIQLLLTDVIMPEMNGRDLSDLLHALYPNIRTLFMSGYTANAIAHRAILEPGVNFIQKPFSKEDLALKVRTALGRN